jgi:DNA-binding MarR family transcriptional regulator
MDIDFRKIMGCTCLRMRRATRRVTQLYDHALLPAELTINQFGLLAYLHGATLAKSNPPSIGTMAEWLGMDPTTLNRNLKPLIARDLARSTPDPVDGRVRVVRITGKGQRSLLKAVPLWQQAQAQVEEALGQKETAALNGLLDLSSTRVKADAPSGATLRARRPRFQRGSQSAREA